ncbi:MAG: hypothetical protein HQM16_02550 [Deltaproteobacteria bacterium]|nr:hypothetical protein [Deltaproteobacteria bacterium]
MTETTTISQLISVEKQPTVVRLDHLSTGDAGWISQGYYLTEQVQGYLKNLENCLSANKGLGFFLIGHFGSGKSHFLAYLAQQIKTGSLAGFGVRAYPVSLLNYRADQTLESIIESNLGIAATHKERDLNWQAFESRVSSKNMLILDELSEFLRSKPTPQSFNEDVRYLQYLGERGQNHTLWVIAAMQEKIENTGEIDGDLFRKIRDRYPARFILNPAHVRDLISRRILKKKEPYKKAMDGLIAKLKQNFAEDQISYADIVNFYPLHPETINLLEEIRDRFSQARGIIEFTLSRLAGNPSRGIAPFLDRDLGEFLTPDYIVSHFEDLFEIQPEFMPLSRKVLPCLKKELPALFNNEKQRALAFRLLNLLILAHLSPVRNGITSNNAVLWLLQKTSTVDPSRNKKIIEGMLNQMVDQASYIKKADDRFFLDIEDDSRQNLDRIIEKTAGEIKDRGESLFDLLIPLFKSPDFNPFETEQNTWQTRSVTWYFHQRKISVFTGAAPHQDKTTNLESVKLKILLPWGNRETLSDDIHYFVPDSLKLTPDILELAALTSITERPLSPDLINRARERLKQKSGVLFKQVRMCFISGDIISPFCPPQKLFLSKPPQDMTELVNTCAIAVFKKTYPQFESYAPSMGPLPPSVYREFLIYVTEHDLFTGDPPDKIAQIIEGYLVPLKLIKRMGRGYSVMPHLERHELVAKISQTAAQEPSVDRVCQMFFNPVYGLVPEQVNFLLLFLLIHGEIDIIKNGVSYRDACHELPNPSAYDVITPGKGLSPPQIRKLEEICFSLNIRTPQQWNVLAQRQIGTQLRVLARKQRDDLGRFLSRVQEEDNAEEAQSLTMNIQRLMSYWHALEDNDELDGLMQFLYQVDAAHTFLELHQDMILLQAQIEKLIRERARFAHLFSNAIFTNCTDPIIKDGAKDFVTRPTLAEPTELRTWLSEAEKFYLTYTQWYKEAHAKYQDTLKQSPAFGYTPPRVADLKAVGLDGLLAEFKAGREKLKLALCHGVSSLEFSPLCRCGFDGENTTTLSLMSRLRELADTLEASLCRFFKQKNVYQKIKAWAEAGQHHIQGGNIIDYINGKAPYPDPGADLELFNKHLMGLETCKKIEMLEFLKPLTNRIWKHADFKAEVLKQIQNFPEVFRIETAETSKTGDAAMMGLGSWCLEHAIRHGVPLPDAISHTGHQWDASALMQQGWVGAACLDRLEDLNLGEQAEDTILKWIFEGAIPLAASNIRSGLVKTAGFVLSPPTNIEITDLAAIVHDAYCHHYRFLKLLGKKWLQFLGNLSNNHINTAPSLLFDLLDKERASQWLLIDGFGIALVNALKPEISKLLPDWSLENVRFCQVDGRTSTAAFWDDVVLKKWHKQIEKINDIDRLVHERKDFIEIVMLARAELGLAIKKIIKRFDPTKPLLVFSDHGFRLSPDGKSFIHGGQSVLERTVPVIKLLPRLGGLSI